MKTFWEIISDIDKDALVEAVANNVGANEPYMADIRECIIDSLEEIRCIAPIANSTILCPFVREGCVNVNVVCIYRETIGEDSDAIVEITSEPLIEYLPGCAINGHKQGRWAFFLGMHVKGDCIGESDLLPFVAEVLSNILPDDVVVDDLCNRVVPREERDALARCRLHEFKLFIDTFSPELNNGYNGYWWYSTAGISRACSWAGGHANKTLKERTKDDE